MVVVIGASATWVPFGEEATPAGAIDAFLSAMKANDANRARELLCDRLKHETTFLAIGPFGYPPNLTWTIYHGDEPRGRGPVSMTVSLEWSNHAADAEVTVVKEGEGLWRVCGSADLLAVPQ